MSLVKRRRQRGQSRLTTDYSAVQVDRSAISTPCSSYGYANRTRMQI